MKKKKVLQKDFLVNLTRRLELFSIINEPKNNFEVQFNISKVLKILNYLYLGKQILTILSFCYKTYTQNISRPKSLKIVSTYKTLYE